MHTMHACAPVHAELLRLGGQSDLLPHDYVRYIDGHVHAARKDLAALVKEVEGVDCYLVVTPEYNHTMPPILTHLMNFVGCSKCTPRR